MLKRPFARYIIAAAAVAVALGCRLAIDSALHAELPTYITFYPAVMLVALLAGQRAGLIATALSALVVAYWVLPPQGQFAIEKPADAVGLVLFCLMGVFMSVVAKRYRRSQERAAAAEKELALQNGRAALAESELQYHTLFTNMSEGFCVIEVIFDAENKPIDYRFLEVNASFEQQTGLHDAQGKLMRDLAPAHEAHWFEIYGKIALTGEPAHFENEAKALGRWYDVHAYRVGEPEMRRVGIIFNDISLHKRSEEALRRQADLLRLSFDAIAVWRLDGGVESWNVGSERLYGFSESEALGRVTHELLRTVHPVPWAQIEAELLEKRFWEGELRHFTKDFREVIVSARKQLIRGADGVERVLETNRDITEHKRAEIVTRNLLDAVQQERDRLSALINSIHDEIWFADLEKKFTLANPAALREFGYASATGIEVEKMAGGLEVYRPDGSPRPIEEAPPLRALKGEVVTDQEEIVRTPSTGDLRHRQVSSAPVRDAAGKIIGSISVVHDITERKQAEEEIQQAKRHAEDVAVQLRSVVENMTERLYVCDSKGHPILVNAAFRGTYPGTDAPEYPHAFTEHWDAFDTAGNSVPVEDWPIGLALRGQEVRGAEFRTRSKFTGKEMISSYNASPVFDSQGKVIMALFTSQDITERKHAEEQLQKLNRTLKALNNSNQALLHATDEPALLQQVCRIVSEDCGHAMVWIGFAENDEDKTVRPAAYSGFEEGYLETMRLTWADSERGRGPTGTAIRTGQPSMCRNMLTDPAYLPWRKEAVRRGYACSLVLPLKEGDKTFGAITIYSREPDTFSEGEVNLLTELAADLAYGIGALRMRAAHAQAEKALRQSEQQFREMAEGIPQLAWTAHPDGAIYWYNQRWYQYTGTSPEQMEGWGWQSVHDPNELPKVLERWKVCIATGETFDMVFPLRGADGVFRPFLTRVLPLRDTQGNVVRWFGTNTDISEQRRIEQALRQSEERWATTLRSIGDAVISTCAQGKIIFMNDVAQTLTGWTLVDAQGKDLETVFNIVNEVTRIKPENPVSRALRLGQVVGLANHTALISRDGTEYPIEDSAAPIRNKDGEITGVVLVFHDVVEKRKAEKALQNSERLATTGRLAATLAHEIHNPLDTVGNLLYLLDQAPDLGESREYVLLAAQEVARVTQMTRHMLAFQRESNKPVPVNIAEILDSVVVLFERKIQSAGIQVEKRVEFEQEFLGLPGEMRQVFANLFGNAVEAVGKNGKIRLSASAAHNWRTGEFGLRVVVADNGPGIPANIRGKIFDPFFTTKGEAGTGLGLWITSGIVHNSGGTLSLRSVTRDGRTGACFSVFLPIK